MIKIEGKFVDELIQNGANIFVVGGAIRDYYLSILNKDIDLIVTGMHIDKLISTLSKFGGVDIVGVSFGIIKFKEKETGLEYDISLPRKEVKNGEGHKGFEILVNHNFSVFDDLQRRDFTINSFCYEVNSETIFDPYNGISDLNSKILRCVSPKSFSDDPLRILRGIQFASRFGFDFDEETENMIKDGVDELEYISKERVFAEFEKGMMKGDPIIFMSLISKYSIDLKLLGVKIGGISKLQKQQFKVAKRISEKLFILLSNSDCVIENVVYNCITNCSDIINELKCLKEIEKGKATAQSFFKAYKYSSLAIETELFEKRNFSLIQNKFRTNEFPKEIKSLEVNGDDLMSYGYYGSDIKNKQLELIEMIFKGEIKNEKKELIKFL